MHFSVPFEISRPKPDYNWSDVYFLASSEQDPFKDAKIVTTKSEYRNNVYEYALTSAFIKYPAWAYRNNKRAENFLRKTEREMTQACTETIQESVERLPDGSFKIVVDIDDINSDLCIDRALELFAQYDGTSKIQYFGTPIRFTSSDFPVDDFMQDDD